MVVSLSIFHLPNYANISDIPRQPVININCEPTIPKFEVSYVLKLL